MAPIGVQTKTVAALNDATTWMEVPRKHLVSVSVQGSFTATIALQRSFDGGASAETIESYTAAVAKNMEPAEDQAIRLIATAYTAGSPTLRLAF